MAGGKHHDHILVSGLKYSYRHEPPYGFSAGPETFLFSAPHATGWPLSSGPGAAGLGPMLRTGPTPAAACLSPNHIQDQVRCYAVLSSSLSMTIIFFFLGPHLRHMEVPRLGIESEVQLPAFTAATAMPDPSRLCQLHHSPRQHGIPNPQSKARDQTWNFMVPSRIHFRCATSATPSITFIDCSPLITLTQALTASQLN